LVERSGTIDKAGQTRLTQLKEELAQIEKAKKVLTAQYIVSFFTDSIFL
jgi:hypothetical protein